MPNKVSIDKLSDEVMNILLAYSEEVEEIIRETAKEVGTETAVAIKKEANALYPAGVNYSTGEYARSWTHGKKSAGQHNYTEVVYARAPHYRLTHLLENGHEIVDRNGKSHGYWNPKAPHVQPVEQTYIEKFNKLLKERIENVKQRTVPSTY